MLCRLYSITAIRAVRLSFPMKMFCTSSGCPNVSVKPTATAYHMMTKCHRYPNTLSPMTRPRITRNNFVSNYRNRQLFRGNRTSVRRVRRVLHIAKLSRVSQHERYRNGDEDRKNRTIRNKRNVRRSDGRTPRKQRNIHNSTCVRYTYVKSPPRTRSVLFV